MTDKKDDDRQNHDGSAVAAANIARAKLDRLYEHEPSAKEEIKEVADNETQSKHQKYMLGLTKSGKSLAEIQTAWHQYYADLPDKEKHEVWQEFYDEHERAKKTKPKEKTSVDDKIEDETKDETQVVPKKEEQAREKPISRAKTSGRISRKQHLQSIVFGLGLGTLVVVFILFGFFNERFIAPFITPSKSVSSTPIIIDPTSNIAGPESKVIIPKINVEIPVIYDSKDVINARTSDELEAGIQKTLENGVVHYPGTPKPGEQGNVPIVGHSSNNIFNQGKYKFAFVLLSKLDKGDTFYLTHNRVRYTYKIYEKRVVKPGDVSVLGAQDKPATATLITCDPPGTSINRLIVVGEQISPSPTKNKAPATTQTTTTEVLPGNAQSLWSRFINWVF